MARQKEDPLTKILRELDKKVDQRGKAVLADVDLSADIVRLASQARKHGATMPELAARVKRMDRKERVLKPITRQAMDAAMAVKENRRPARTTRESRKRRPPKPAGTINAEALR
jgi:hypothetical protein